MELTAGEMVAELTEKLERVDSLLIDAARLIHQVAPPRTATRLLMRVRDYTGDTRFKNEVLD